MIFGPGGGQIRVDNVIASNVVFSINVLIMMIG